MEFLNEVIARLQAFVVVARERQEGQTLVEYALILAFVSILSIAALTTLSTQINDVFAKISAAL